MINKNELERDLLTTSDVAQLMKVTERQVANYVKDKRLAFVLIGKRPLFIKTDVVKLITQIQKEKKQ
jgi:excisionase family DNA binding protein